MNQSQTILVINKKICCTNIAKMAEKCKKNNVSLRPHVMTHRSTQIASWFRTYGIDKIAVSSFNVAEYFMEHGWDDITVTVPFNIHHLDQLNQLNEKIKLQVVAEHLSTLEKVEAQITKPISIYLKIDTDGEILGVAASNTAKIEKIIQFLHAKKDKFIFKGFLAHPYHTFLCKTRHGVNSIHYDTILQLRKLRNMFQSYFPKMELVLGDTLSALICNDFRNISEIQPSTFVFNDALTWKMGACKLEDIALRIRTTVIAKNKARNEIVIQSNEQHLTRNSYINVDGKPLYGRIIKKVENKDILLGELNYIHKMSLTHATIKVTPSEFFKIKRGDTIEVIPVKAPATFNSCQWGLTEEQEVIHTMPQKKEWEAYKQK
ncbi:alanine racemase [Halosquirtibacter xylanolyticus]|uniref:alanine racemase n=1 Tax=Halosquirtibacter xylanolyticus TaxID=3374599 RepID=UPI0037496028|nr:alanine racemase [Prolixibacteraceae bacterium]